MAVTSPLNGKTGELLRFVAGLALAGLVSYFTAMQALSVQIAEVRKVEEAHFDELKRAVERVDGQLLRVNDYLLRLVEQEHKR